MEYKQLLGKKKTSNFCFLSTDHNGKRNLINAPSTSKTFEKGGAKRENRNRNAQKHTNPLFGTIKKPGVKEKCLI